MVILERKFMLFALWLLILVENMIWIQIQYETLLVSYVGD